MSDQIIGFINPAIVLIFSAVFVALWLRAPANRYVLAFAVGNVGFAFSMLLFHYLPDPNTWISQTLIYIGLIIWVICYCWGASRRVGQSIPLKIYLAIAFAAYAMSLLTIPDNNESARLFITNGSMGLILALTAQNIARTAPRNSFDKAVVWMFAIIAAQSYARPFLAMVTRDGAPAEIYRQSEFYAVFIVTVSLLSVLMGLVLCAAVFSDNLRKLQLETETDPLTGLRIRRKFEEEAVEALDRANLRNVPIGIIVADIDLFKQVNDIFGHQAGDKVIASFGDLLNGMTRNNDIAGRVGGEEFCVVAWNCDETAIKALAERIRVAFASTEHSGISPDVRLTASFGVAAWKSGEGYGRLFARADAALYRAKRQGRNQVVADDGQPHRSEGGQDEKPAGILVDRRAAS